MSDANSIDLLERYRRLNDLSRDLASTLDLNTLLNRIAGAASVLCNAEAASILLYDEIKGELFFETTTNTEDPLMRGMAIPVENSIAGWIVINRKAVIISDAQKDPRHYNGIKDATRIVTNSLLGVPMIAKEKVIGVLEVINKRAGEFDTEDQDLLSALGAVAAVAIENARLFQQSDLISELVHELRTPLTSLNTASTLMLNSQLSKDARTELVQVMLKETRRLSNMTTDFLDLARLETGRVHYLIEDVELKAILKECVQLMDAQAGEGNIKIVLHNPGQIPTIKGDRSKIKQVVLNLLSNAIKYNKPYGNVDVEVEVLGQELIIKVMDTGVGIPSESIPFLFDKFYRVPGTERKAKGTGLGLSISKRIVEDHGGHIEVESQSGKGATFLVRLLINPALE